MNKNGFVLFVRIDLPFCPTYYYPYKYVPCTSSPSRYCIVGCL